LSEGAVRLIDVAPGGGRDEVSDPHPRGDSVPPFPVSSHPPARRLDADLPSAQQILGSTQRLPRCLAWCLPRPSQFLAVTNRQRASPWAVHRRTGSTSFRPAPMSEETAQPQWTHAIHTTAISRKRSGPEHRCSR
jgi:hypothetical protein